ncbi:MAG: hypothetical protein OEY34_07815, partial [Cyclobacteriaceae bacterium]|nr:hypothetical protein [Cyclobacteriaceae bacterium]
HYADAEGFSNAIMPSMEYDDIDALNTRDIRGKSFSITMKNEALETHCINEVKLLAIEKGKGERVFQSTGNEFYVCEETFEIHKARAAEGDVTSLLQWEDRMERFSLADEKNLNSREEIYLDFIKVNPNTDIGLILNFRQTLMTTYLFYSAMGYMGDEAGDIFAKLETDENLRDKLNDGIFKELGEIEIYLWDEGDKEWKFQDDFSETGPIAINRQFVPLKIKPSGTEVKIKLVLNKGHWRIDYAALATIKKRIEPKMIVADSILNKGLTDNRALADIHNPKAHLISMPGSEYKFFFTLPEEDKSYELFLYSKGYYLEWMREQWIKDKDLNKLRMMVEHPKKYLKNEASEYKQYEKTMEQQFWNSKIDTKTFSYYDN